MSWNAPSTENQKKFHLVPLPDDFQPTEEEKALVKMYETIKNYERQAVRLKDQQMRDKMAAKQSEFNEKNQTGTNNKKKKKKSRRKKQRKENMAGDDGDDMIDDDDEEDDGSSGSYSDNDDESLDDEQTTLEERRNQKLDALRDEVDKAKRAMVTDETKEENLRQNLLSQNEDIKTIAPLKRRKLQDTGNGGGLISNMKIDTPVHEFSERLDIKPGRGKILFPSTPDEVQWNPPEAPANPNEGAFLVELDDFDISKAQNGAGNNTIVVKFHAPSDSKRFSINIAGPGHNDFNSVLFHFNPRQFERHGQLVVNDKQDGTWGKSIELPLSQIPLIFGEAATTLQIQITGEGFDIFLGDEHCARLEHRIELPSKPCSLFLQFPSCDDYASPENWTVYRAWWGNKPIMARGDVSGVAGVNGFNATHPRKLFISGLQKISTQAEVDLRRAELERAFRKYGGTHGVTCIVPKDTTFAFVEMESERQADLALSEMSTKYPRINRARRSRHEALQEKRAAEEAAKAGKTEDTGGW